MRARMFLAYWCQTLIAMACVPVMRLTGWRFDRSWRGNWFVHHVAANMWADGYPVQHPKFY